MCLFQNGSISRDAPEFSPDPMKKFHIPNATPGRKQLITRQIARRPGPHESSHVLPGGESLLKHTIRVQEERKNISRRASSRLFPHGKQTYLDHIDVNRTAIGQNIRSNNNNPDSNANPSYIARYKRTSLWDTDDAGAGMSSERKPPVPPPAPSRVRSQSARAPASGRTNRSDAAPSNAVTNYPTQFRVRSARPTTQSSGNRQSVEPFYKRSDLVD